MPRSFSERQQLTSSSLLQSNETAEITPLLAETGAAAAETGGLAAVATGAAEALGGAAAAALAPEVAIPAALGLVAGAGGAMLAGRSEAGTQTEPPRGSGVAAAAGGALEGVRAGASAFPTARNIGRAGGAAVGGLGAAALGLGMGAVGGAYQGARYMLGGGDAASSSGSEFQDVRTLNGMQQGAPQERISVRQPRVQQPIMVSRLNSSEDDAPAAQQQEQPRPQVRSRPAPQPRMPFGLNPVSQTSSGSESYGPVRRPRPQRPEPSFNELRREALAREPEAA